MLVEDHHVPLGGGIAQALENQLVPVVQGGHHGAAVHADETAHKGEHQNQSHQNKGEGLEPEVEIQLEGLGAGDVLTLRLRPQLPLASRHGVPPPLKYIGLYYTPFFPRMQGGRCARGRGRWARRAGKRSEDPAGFAKRGGAEARGPRQAKRGRTAQEPPQRV